MNKSILLFAALLSSPCFAQEKVSLFDGKTLKGWTVVKKANAKYWSVVDGVVTASSHGKKMPTNTYLATNKNYQNFEFTCQFRLSGDHATGLINSGLQYRSIMQKTPNKPGTHHIIGYQADIGKGYWGDVYDEHRRGKLLKGDTKALLKDFKEDGWNSYKILCEDNRHRLYINGHLTADYLEKNPKIPSLGVFALQLHSGGIATMEYKDIFIKELPATAMKLRVSLRKSLPATAAKIHGKTMRLQGGNKIVSWNKTSEFLKWSIPSHIKPGKYEVVLNYSCDKNRQGSAMTFTTLAGTKKFKTTSKAAKWSPSSHSMGVIDIKSNDHITLKCTKLKADWVLDFHDITFVTSQ